MSEQGFGEEPRPDFHTPYYDITLKRFADQFPENSAAMSRVMDEIDEQGIKSFKSFESETYPGTAFSYTSLKVEPKLVTKLAESAPQPAVEPEQTPDSNLTRQDYFLFTAFALPPDGHAFTVEDVAIDRFVRLIPTVAYAMKHGKQIPDINIHLLGSPYGYGGKVDEAWIKSVQEKGLDAYGPLYAEFVKKFGPKDEELEHSRVVLQGVSKGAVIADKTSTNLPENMQKITQRLLDNPGGNHTSLPVLGWVQSLRMAVGLGVEFVSTSFFSETAKSLSKQTGFVDRLAALTGIRKDAPDQLNLKRKAAWAEAQAIMKGSPISADRAYIRQGLHDPVSWDPINELLVRKHAAKTPNHSVIMTEGKHTTVPFEGRHFFVYDRYPRWNQILNYAKNLRPVA